jgi:hypothetical protein
MAATVLRILFQAEFCQRFQSFARLTSSLQQILSCPVAGPFTATGMALQQYAQYCFRFTIDESLKLCQMCNKVWRFYIVILKISAVEPRRRKMFARQSKHPTRDAALIAAALVTGVTPSASGQTLADNASRLPTAAATRVSPGECSTFASYIVDELKAFPELRGGALSSSAKRFIKAGCAARDADGEIQIVIETNQEAASLLTARRRMGTIDIIGASGVSGCVRPPNGVCPAKTGTTSSPRPAKGG